MRTLCTLMAVAMMTISSRGADFGTLALVGDLIIRGGPTPSYRHPFWTHLVDGGLTAEDMLGSGGILLEDARWADRDSLVSRKDSPCSCVPPTNPFPSKPPGASRWDWGRFGLSQPPGAQTTPHHPQPLCPGPPSPLSTSPPRAMPTSL